MNTRQSELYKDSKPGITVLSVLAFLCGVVSQYIIRMVGEIYAAEVLLAPLAIAVLFFGNTQFVLRRRILVLFIFTGAITLVGYMLTDLYLGTPSDRYLRGWGRVAFMISDFVALAILAANNKRNIWWFVFGLGIGKLVGLITGSVLLSGWKLGYGDGVILVAACLSSLVSIRANSIAFVSVGLISIAMDSRIQGVICLLVAILLWVRAKRPERIIQGLSQYWKVIVVGAVVFGVFSGIYIETQQEFASRREQSTEGRMIQIRVSLLAIAESPIIGYGSWSQNEKFAKMVKEETAKAEGTSQLVVVNRELFGPHSQILQAWVEGGILAITFFVVFGYQSFRALKYVALRRPVDSYTSIFLFFLAFGLWHLFMSPFAGSHRIYIALSVAIICVVALEVRAKQLELTRAKSDKILSQPVRGR